MQEAIKTLGGEIGYAVLPELASENYIRNNGFVFYTHSKLDVRSNTPKVPSGEYASKLDYYKWATPNYSLAIGCVYLLIFDNGWCYVGQHIGSVVVKEDMQALEDGYTGSGVLLPTIKEEHKYKMSIIDLFYTREQGNYREKYWINYKGKESKKRGYNVLNKSVKTYDLQTKDCRNTELEKTEKNAERYRQIIEEKEKGLLLQPIQD